ncbi:oxidoreductase zinc-binding dehydrogenase family superfamily [Fusarium subglutinans]|uniref:Oxidoreductase zinc-binding dehydrogenase family superfamily n=1 Tax=Gibberella subglutinans TaxID=42677 RepID=A0A8H5V992_GIBSU|nr:oxidoreductase zinc-binding dehydrogenase family superfamily [Fusarium subglutinans]KAF5613893.1 oxidoreductase zinc-binding dehydrogenase family superfamily [Fusarium subglutinans]
MTSNNAAYLVAEMAPLEVKPAPYPEPKDDEIIIENHAVALNPVDSAQQRLGPSIFPWLKFPAILGCDVAGRITAVGSGIAKHKVGDRVIGSNMGTFQEYVPVKEHLCAKLPDNIGFEEAAVLPLCLSVAVKALFHPDYLALDLPTPETQANGKVILIWGGSTSVGCNIIQLAKAAGFEVITTASPKNFDYLKKLGASQTFDYSSPTIKEDLLAAVKGKVVAGAIANGGLDVSVYPSIVDTCAAVALSSPDNCKLVPLTMVPRFPLPDGVETKFVVPLATDKDLASWIFNDYISEALASGNFVPAPEAEVVGHGLGSLQSALDTLDSGVSAKKIVVTMK